MKHIVLSHPCKIKKEMDKVDKAFRLNNLIFIGAIFIATFVYIVLSISIT